MSQIRCLHFGSYWMGANDVVYLMAHELRKLYKAELVDTNIYSNNVSQWFKEDSSKSKEFVVRWLSEEKVLSIVDKTNSKVVICNSGGQSLLPSTIFKLRQKNITTVCISLSDPDVFHDNGKIYSPFYDLVYTNSQFAAEKLYPSIGVNAKVLPFAASPQLHKPLKNIKKKYDIVIVGHARPDRSKLVEKLSKSYNIGLFGKGWKHRSTEVHGKKHAQAINSGKIYLSFASTQAGFNNVKVGIFEAAACGSCIFTSMFPEMNQYFNYGSEIIGYTNEDMLMKGLTTYLTDNTLRAWIGNNAHKRVMLEHTWKHRWQQLLKDVLEKQHVRRK